MDDPDALKPSTRVILSQKNKDYSSREPLAHSLFGTDESDDEVDTVRTRLILTHFFTANWLILVIICIITFLPYKSLFNLPFIDHLIYLLLTT